MSSAEYSCRLFKPSFAYRQTVWTLIRLLLKEQSDLGPHCLQKWLLKSQADTKQTIVVTGALRVKTDIWLKKMHLIRNCESIFLFRCGHFFSFFRHSLLMLWLLQLIMTVTEKQNRNEWNRYYKILMTPSIRMKVSGPQNKLMLSTQSKIFSRRPIEIFFLFFPENRSWHFMQIVFTGDNLHEMSKPVFCEE